MSADTKIQWSDLSDGERAIMGAIGTVFRIDDDGRVWRIATGSRAENRTTLGYLVVRLMVDGRRHHVGAHRIVWMHFSGQCVPRGCVVNHLNGTKDDNRPSNLEACTVSENAKHAHRTGLSDQHGERNPSAKLSDAAVESIRIQYARGGESQSAIADRFGISFKTVSKIVRGDRRKKQPGPTADYLCRRSSAVRVREFPKSVPFPSERDHA